MDPAIRQRVEQACQQGVTSIHATGSSPGFSTTTMPLTLVYPMRRLDELTIDEYADIPASVGPDMITKVMRFGAPVHHDELDPRLLQGTAEGYQQSLTAFADAIGLPLDSFEVRGEIARATEPTTLSDGSVIEKGTMAAQRITVAGLRNGRPFLSFRAHWFCTTHLDPDWNITGEGWLFTTKGDAPMQVRVTYGRTDEGYGERVPRRRLAVEAVDRNGHPHAAWRQREDALQGRSRDRGDQQQGGGLVHGDPQVLDVVKGEVRPRGQRRGRGAQDDQVSADGGDGELHDVAQAVARAIA
ncbi:hypothetical protein BCD48_43955 [Pseudofrankia sp. BMG5.36]|nr:hypothetical protein BCD48_43955 [Pseudofrankia sp. BMG5.36]